MKRIAAYFFVIFAFASFGKAVSAAAPPFLPIQGYLEDAAGDPVSGDVSIGFAVYDAEVEGNRLWYETQNVLVEEGVFAVYLGEVESIDLAMFRDHAHLWLGIQVEGDEEMGRVYLGSTPFTGYAEYCGSIPDHSHDFSSLTGTEAVAAGEQGCTGDDKVVGIDISGALVCATDEDTTYLAGSGLLLAGTTFSVNTDEVQARVADACPPGNSVRQINADGTVVCEADDDTLYSAGAGLSLAGTTFSLDASFQDGSAYDARFVNAAGDTVTGDLEVSGNVKGGNLYFHQCGGRYLCTPRECLDACIGFGMRMATYDEIYAWASGGSDSCAYMWFLHTDYPDQPCRGYPMYHNSTSGGCGRIGTGDIPRVEGFSCGGYTWDSTTEYDCACAGLR